jgi:hypothetical protein
VDSQQVSTIAREFVKKFAYDATNLKYKPSQIAAAGVTLAVSVSQQPYIKSLNLRQLTGLNKKCFYQARQTTFIDQETISTGNSSLSFSPGVLREKKNLEPTEELSPSEEALF